MGINRTEKRMKTTKKCRIPELVSNGESTEDASPSKYDDKYPTMDKNEEDAPGADVTTKKSKKARRIKNKDALTSEGHHKALNQGGVEPDSEHCSRKRKGKSKKAKDRHSSNEESKLVQEVEEVAMHDVYQISSGDDDCSKGMKKWIKEYHENRPGLKVLQQRIDDFITAHEEQEEQARKEKEANIAEEGWTVVVHRKGGKKTTDPDSGVAVGSVAEAAVRDKMSKKKNKDVGLDFYRFQRREAKRSEIMQLQSKFQEDRKRIQQLRAARKFRPY